MNASQIADRLELIADALNDASYEGDYNRFDHFADLAFEQELDVDFERQDTEGPECGHELHTVEGSLHYSDAWRVDYDSIAD